jgi:hypothetical protein
MDRLTSLTVFIRVVEGGGFSAGARRLKNMSVTAENSLLAGNMQGTWRIAVRIDVSEHR